MLEVVEVAGSPPGVVVCQPPSPRPTQKACLPKPPSLGPLSRQTNIINLGKVSESTFTCPSKRINVVSIGNKCLPLAFTSSPCYKEPRADRPKCKTIVRGKKNKTSSTGAGLGLCWMGCQVTGEAQLRVSSQVQGEHRRDSQPQTR